MRKRERVRVHVCVYVCASCACLSECMICLCVCACVCCKCGCASVGESVRSFILSRVSLMLVRVCSLSCVRIRKHLLSAFCSICFSHTHTYIYTHSHIYTTRGVKNQNIQLPQQQPPRAPSSSPPLPLPLLPSS